MQGKVITNGAYLSFQSRPDLPYVSFLRTAYKSVFGFPNIFEIAGERIVSSYCTFVHVLHRGVAPFELTQTHTYLALISFLATGLLCYCSNTSLSIVQARYDRSLFCGGRALITHVSAISRTMMKKVNTLLKRLGLLVFCTSLTCRVVLFFLKSYS